MALMCFLGGGFISFSMFVTAIAATSRALTTVTDLVYKALYSKMSAPAEKKAKTSATIGTHDGTFHCDEALACYLLKRLPQYKVR